jgi:hypothetical protein
MGFEYFSGLACRYLAAVSVILLFEVFSLAFLGYLNCYHEIT